MDLETAIRGRRSVRRFTDEPVAEDTLRELLDLARWSPSWANTQSWSVLVATGATLAKIKSAIASAAETKAERRFELPAPNPDWPAHLRARTQQLIQARQAATGQSSPAPSADLFGAPCAVYLAVDQRLRPEYACYDAGLFTQTLCLAAHGKGLGTCIMASAIGYPEILHELLPAAADKRFVIGVALGHPDPGAAVNRFERARAGLDELVSFAR